MSVIIMIIKIFISIFLIGMLIGGAVKLSPAHRNPDISPKIEYAVGAFGLVLGLLGLYFTWLM